MTPTGLRSGDLITFSVKDLDDRMKAISYAIWLSIADPFTVEWTSRVLKTANVPARVDRPTIDAIFAALKAAVRYEYHPLGTDRFQTLQRTIKLGSADCDCDTVALAAALHTCGFQVGCRIESADGETWGHILALVYPTRNVEPPRLSDGTYDTRYWMPLDLTTGPDGTPTTAVPGYQVPLTSLACYRDFVFDLAL